MYFTVTYDRPVGDPGNEPVLIGWLRSSDKSGVLYPPPERVIFRGTNRAHAKTAGRCPAVINMESRYFMVRCPFDIHIGFTRNAEGRPALVNRAGPMGAVRSNKLGQAIVLVNEDEWRYPDRPTIQLKLPYICISDELVYLTQLDAFAHYRKVPLPGTIFGGRFAITNWPRPLMWALEWHDTSKDLVLKRGDPLFYLTFEADNPDRPVQMVEAERTPELQAYIEHVEGAVNYTNQTFSLFREAEVARPRKLLTPKARSD